MFGAVVNSNLEWAGGLAQIPSGCVDNAGQTLQGSIPDPRATLGQRGHHVADSLASQQLIMSDGH